jgi:ATPase
VFEIRNFENNVLEHEIYTFGEENVIVPVTKHGETVGIQKLAEDKIKDYFQKYDSNVQVDILSENRVKVSVHEDCIASIIGRGGTNINEIEKFLNVHIDVVAKDSESLSLGSEKLKGRSSEPNDNDSESLATTSM